MYDTIRDLLFRIDAELAHEIACKGAQLATQYLGHPFEQEVKAASYTCMGLTFPNRVGLAAGMDKNGEYIETFSDMGFGFLEIGTVTIDPQPGNPRPRYWVQPVELSIKNNMGMPNKGAAIVAANVVKARRYQPVGISVAANTGADNPVESIALAFIASAFAAEFIVLNLSCPNVEQKANPWAVLRRVSELRTELREGFGKAPPVLVKLPRGPHTTEDFEALLWRVRAFNFDGVVIANIGDAKTSGPTLLEDTLRVVRFVRNMFPKFTIIASGGIFSPLDAEMAIDAGADMVQIYTALVYKGPKIVKEMAEAIG